MAGSVTINKASAADGPGFAILLKIWVVSNLKVMLLCMCRLRMSITASACDGGCKHINVKFFSVHFCVFYNEMYLFISHFLVPTAHKPRGTISLLNALAEFAVLMSRKELRFCLGMVCLYERQKHCLVLYNCTDELVTVNSKP